MYENTQKVGQPEKEEPVIMQKFGILRRQSVQLNDEIVKDLYSLSDRLKSIGVRLNSTNHPDNAIKDEKTMSVNCSDPSLSSKYPTDGIEGDFNYVIDQNQTFINDFFNNHLKTLNKNISYIESHI